MRFKLPPGGDVPPAVAARRIGLAVESFNEALPALMKRGFPAADPTTGNYDLDAIDAWRRRRFPHLYPGDGLTPPATARNARDVVAARVAGMKVG
jgi:hypothetical protein